MSAPYTSGDRESRPEIAQLLNPSAAKPPHEEDVNCSDVLVNRPRARLFAHNEDAGVNIRSFAYVVRVRFDPTALPGATSFTSYHLGVDENSWVMVGFVVAIVVPSPKSQ